MTRPLTLAMTSAPGRACWQPEMNVKRRNNAGKNRRRGVFKIEAPTSADSQSADERNCIVWKWIESWIPDSARVGNAESCLTVDIPGDERRAESLTLPICFCRRSRARGRSLAGIFQRPIDYGSHLLLRLHSREAFAIDEHRRRRFHTNLFPLGSGCHYGSFILSFRAGVEFGQVEASFLSNIVSQTVQARVCLLDVSSVAVDLFLVVMRVIREIPISIVVLRGQTICIDGCVHGPGVHLDQGIVLVHELHFIAIGLQQIGEERLVHARAEGTFEVVV